MSAHTGAHTSAQSAPSSHASIGGESGRARVGASTVRDLGSHSAVLPEIVDAPQRQRPWWRHPAFIVSVVTTFLALGAVVAWWIVTMVTDDAVRVSNLTIGAEAGNVALHWDGPDAEYALYEVSAGGEVTDLSQLVVGTSAWVFSAAALYDDGSCFVVRPASRTEEVSLDAASLQAQNGAAVCVVDAR